jgi:hypothetical protein
MRNFKNIKYYALGLLLFNFSCDTEDELIEERVADNTVPPISYLSGDADFSNYISLGNSLTAGLMDAALYTEGQDSSFPNIIGGQLVKAGFDTEFNQPDINAVNGYNISLNTDPNVATFGKFILDTSIPGPVPTLPGDLITAYSGDKTKLNNFGVPGATLSDLLTPALATNGLYARFATNPGASTVLGDALATNPTFYTLWIGSNDVLEYALAGGVGAAPLDVYSAGQFQADYGSIIGQLAAKEAKGVVINIPPVLLIPYLRAVPNKPIPMDAATAAQVNAAYADYNGGLAAALNATIITQEEHDLRVINFVAGANGFVTEDPELTDVNANSGGAIPIPKYRQTNANDLIPLSAGAILGTLADPNNPSSAYGVGVALGDKYVLTKAEQTAVVTARATYSGVIAGIAAVTPGVEMFDIQPLFADIAGLTATDAAQLALTAEAQTAADGVKGTYYEGVYVGPDFSPSGIFSTDGVHPNPRGHAIIANELIDFINDKFNSTIPKVNTTIYRTVLFK